METNPSRPLGDVKQSGELPVVEVVPVAAADEPAIEPGEARDRALDVRLTQHEVLMRVLGGLSHGLERVGARRAREPQRLVAGDRGDPCARPLRRLAAVAPAPRAHGSLLRSVLRGPRKPQHVLRLAQALRAERGPIPVVRCNELNGQEGLPAMTLTLESDAARAYAVLAPAYDLLTAEYAYGPWLAAIERLARRHGLSGRRLLDVGCGTGKSFLPLLDRGFDVCACDISPEMVAEAEHKAGGRAAVHVADMRRLPVLGAFDLITCLDDGINHLLDRDEVADALSGLRENLAPGGLLVFDVNTLAAYRE